MYHIEKTLKETGDVVDDGLHEIFVNTTIDDGSMIADLMNCFTKKEVHNANFPKFSKRVHDLKNTEGGANAMCEVMEKYEQKAVTKANVEAIKFMVTTLNASKEQILQQYSEYEYREALNELSKK